ncbi:MAG TPA: aspartate/tyrosine/aromatic aminotransferase [Desulfobulbaceae bacterium]|nr:aspartate/tyrosine/aromatic aminotransferase [Desulfobulbaceae bacterium]
MWENIQPAPPDSILGLTEEFKKDRNPGKVNLGVGVYKDNNGRTPILGAVKKAEQQLLARETTKSYLPISGDPAYGRAVQKLVLGEDSDAFASSRAVTVHAPGGTGALKVGADLLKRFKPQARVWVSSPTWANHNGIFGDAGFELDRYSYYNPESKGLDFDRMLDDLGRAPAGDIVVLHACCHNPSGVDLNQSQWDEVVRVADKQGWIPFLDFAYQGFGDGVGEDRYAVERFAASGMDFLVASSFSKNFGLYNERTGALTIICPGVVEAKVAMSHVKTVIRTNYSNPPAHGGLVATIILEDSGLYQEWLAELADMRERIKNVRRTLVKGLADCGVPGDFSFIERQRGMFSFSGLSDEVVKWLRAEKSIYVVGGGRINLAGLTTDNLDYVCSSIAEAIKAVP